MLPKNFSLQPQQKFIRDFFSSKFSNDGILIYHKIGAGKTCTAVAIKKLKKENEYNGSCPRSINW